MPPASEGCSGTLYPVISFMSIVMRIFCRLFCTSFLTATICLTVRADEPHLELIRALRAQGEPGLAMEYIQSKLAKPPADLAGILPLEIARTRVELALQENEEGKRLAMFAEARAEFESFLQKDPNNPLAPQARFEIARLISSLGKEHLNRARRLEDKDAAKKTLDIARPFFQDAAAKLQEAAQIIKTQLDKNPDDKATARELRQAYLQAGLEEGTNLYNLAQTYRGAADTAKRGEAIDRAIKVLAKVADEDAKHPTCWLARAWLGRCYASIQDFPKAKSAFDTVFAERGPYADIAQRVAGYFQLLMLADEGQTPPAQLESRANGWLSRYRSYLNTPEGFGMRFFLASLLWNQGKPGITFDQKTGRPTGITAVAETSVARAERLMRELTESENDFTERAAHERSTMLLVLALRRFPSRDLTRLTSFESCYMLGQLEIAELNQDINEQNKKGDADPEDIAKLRKTRYTKVAKAIDKALGLVKPNDPAKDVLDARQIQVYAHLVIGDYARAAELGEALAKTQTRAARGASAELYALQAYRSMLADLQAAGDAKEEDLRKIKDNIRRVAKFMEDTWPNDTPTDFARHQLGALLAAEGDFVGALQAFARVTPNYQRLAYLRNEEGVACFNLQRAKVDGKTITPKVKRDWLTKVQTDLEKMPDLGAGADGDTAAVYCLARLQAGNLYLQEGRNYARVEQIAKSILDSLPKYVVINDKNRADLTQQAQAMRYYGISGQMFEAVKGGDHAGAAKLYQPIVAELMKKGGIPAEEQVKVRTALANLLQLALRSTVQEGAISRAQDILKLLDEVSTGLGNSGALVQVLREVQLQINDLKKHNPEKLKETVDRFASFLDDLAKAPNLSADLRIFLAQGYASLDKPARAVELLAAIPAPPTAKDVGPPPSEPKEGASEEEQKKYEEAKEKFEVAKAKSEAAQKSYWFAQLTQVRALRQLGRDDNNPKSPHFEEAQKLLNQMIGTPQNKGWAFNSLEVRREQIFILEDRGQFRDALGAWTANQKPFLDQMIALTREVKELKDSPKPGQEEVAQKKDVQLQRVRQVVYEYHFYKIHCVYLSKARNTALAKDAKKKEEEFHKVAKNIIGVEKDPQTADFGGNEVKKLYKEMLDNDDLLMKAYRAEGGTALLQESDSRTTSSP